MVTQPVVLPPCDSSLAHSWLDVIPSIIFSKKDEISSRRTSEYANWISIPVQYDSIEELHLYLRLGSLRGKRDFIKARYRRFAANPCSAAMDSRKLFVSGPSVK